MGSLKKKKLGGWALDPLYNIKKNQFEW